MIRVLDKAIADKIAAGEVIERPVSIVKELVENSLDAGATSVTIEIKNGGKSYIRVTDNGVGIAREEAQTAFLRHATSKISSVKDLDAIETLGFRGEALASIAAVTNCELITKTSGSKTGTRILIRGGQFIRNEQTGCPDGTTFIITDLFFNTPARRKFLKSDGAESSMIIDFVSRIALAYKDIKFSLINNGNVLFTTPGDGKYLSNIVRIYRDVDAKNMVPVSYSAEGLSLEGYISTPAMSKSTRGSQIFFVNGRACDSKVMEKGVSLGYKERLFEGRYPVVYLFLHVNPETIDVNIHPNKRQVRFDDEQLISDFIARGIKEALGTKDAVVDAGNLFKIDSADDGSSAVHEQVDINSLLSTLRKGATAGVAEEAASEPVKELGSECARESGSSQKSTEASEPSRAQDAVQGAEQAPICTETSQSDGKNDLKIRLEAPAIKPFDITEIKITGIIFDTYITAVDSENFYLIDQHAAQERIFYEKLVGEYDKSEKIRQPLLTPLIINTALSSEGSQGEWINLLEDMGFTIDEFGPGTYRILEIPMFMELSEAEDFVNNFIESIHTSTDLRNTVVVDKLIMMSCKAAIKAGDKLTDAEANALIGELARCVNPFSCPHGRPTFIKLTKYEIEKMFKRV